MKDIVVTLISVVLGSFIAVGILENYKNDEQLKIKVLEKYFIPARSQMNECLTNHSKLIQINSSNIGTFNLIFTKMEQIVNDKALLRNKDFVIFSEAILKTHSKNSKKSNELSNEVTQCYQTALLNLETLSITTGSFDKYNKTLNEKVKLFNEQNKIYNEKIQNIIKDENIEDLNKLLDNLIKSGFESDGNINKLISKKEKINSIQSLKLEFEQKKYKYYRELFLDIKNDSANEINTMFKIGFFEWLKSLI